MVACARWAAWVLAVLLLSHVGGARATLAGACPAGCTCAEGADSDEVRCQTLRLLARRAAYVEIICFDDETPTLSCEDIPHVNYGDNGVLPSLGLKDCPVTPQLSLACVLAALGARGVAALTLHDPPGGAALAEQHVRGGEALEMLVLNTDSEADEISISSAALSSLQRLRTLVLQGGRAALTADVLSAAPAALRSLEVSQQLTEFPRAARAVRLDTLLLFNNDIQELTADALRGYPSLTMLDLSTNSLHSLSGAQLSAAPLLEKLRASRNPLQQLHPLAPLDHLRQLTISDNKYSFNLTLDPAALANLPLLTNVQLLRTGLHHLPASVFSNSSSLQILELCDNMLTSLPEDVFRDQRELRMLNLSGNSLQTLERNVFRPLKKLEELNLNANKLKQLPPLLLDGLSQVTRVSVTMNQLRSLAPAVLHGATQLRDLDLAYNYLAFGAEDDLQYKNLNGGSPFNALVHLQHLNLSHNHIQQLYTDLPVLLTQLRDLDLTHNRLTYILYNELSFIADNATVDLRYNQITTVDLDRAFFLRPPSDNTILFDQNPFDCSCSLYNFSKRLHGYRGLTNEPNMVVGDAVCAQPRALAGRKLRDVQLNEFTCPLPTDQCCSGCNCTGKPDAGSVLLDCSEVPQDVSGLQGYAIELVLQSAPTTLVSLPDSVRSLKLSGLGLKTVPVGIVTKSLQVLDLSQNALTRAPEELSSTNLTLLLAENPFDCDCWSRTSVEQLQLYKSHIADYGAVTCRDRQLVSLVNTLQLCNTLIAATVGGALALLGLFIAVAAVVMYRNSSLVKAILHKLGWCRCWINEEELDKDKLFDAFVSFAHEDEQFVIENLLPGLESGPKPFKLCVHFRDWIVGEWIPAQIARSVEQSRRTIIVVSKKFLESIWGRLEFRAANMSAIKESRTRVIVVLLEDVKGHEELDEELKAYLATNTYLKWGDPWFWERIRYALPHRREERHIRKAGGKLAKKLMISGGPGGLDTQLTADGKIINAALVPQKKKDIV